MPVTLQKVKAANATQQSDEVEELDIRRVSRQLKIESMVHELVVSQAWLDVRTLCTIAAVSRRMYKLSLQPSSLGRRIDLRRRTEGAASLPVSALESLLSKGRVFSRLQWLCIDHKAVSEAEFRAIFRHITHIEHFLMAGIEHSDVLELPKRHCKFIHVQSKSERVRVTYARLQDLLETDEEWLVSMLKSVCDHYDSSCNSQAPNAQNRPALPHRQVLSLLSQALHMILGNDIDSAAPSTDTDTDTQNSHARRSSLSLSTESALVPYFKNTCFDFQTHTPIAVRSLKWSGSPLWVNIKVGAVSLHLYSVAAAGRT